MRPILYHGSGYNQKELMPGFKRSGVIVRWDKTESNEWLYATTDKQEAIGQAFASMMEKVRGITRYKAHGNVIELSVPENRIPARSDMETLEIYLYTITNLEQDEWVKNDNAHNKLLTEWKTQSTISAGIRMQEQIDLHLWLATKRLSFNFDDDEKQRPSYLDW
ncbi:hypothetical protein [Paraburkholderia sp. BCC1886]|uniref:hypothetical protein n=1 Tax=Paraburkholderia sp. BCC1886 TaxID=2562670 RepID=UPI00118369D4|nr:hypothetical protein [Paraburkholderia sp. BCC1886]